MTEAEWLACEEPSLMLAFIRHRVSDRKQRLFACGCCAQMWETTRPELVDRAIRIGEQVADGGGWDGTAQSVWDEIMAAQAREMSAANATTATRLLYATSCIGDNPFFVFIPSAPPSPRNNLLGIPRRFVHWLQGIRTVPDEGFSARGAKAVVRDATIRCVFGNPFRPVAFSPSWRTDTAIALARTMYESREFGAMPILADALQDAGCDSDDVLSHCRGDGPHVRGCWVIDLVLGKE